MRTAWDLMVMPLSRSRSILSSTCACISRSVNRPVFSIILSASVDLPWSICAIMQKFRILLLFIYVILSHPYASKLPIYIERIIPVSSLQCNLPEDRFTAAAPVLPQFPLPQALLRLTRWTVYGPADQWHS